MIENIKLGTPNGSFEGLGEVLICAGFLLIYLIEELVHVTCDRYAQHDHCEDDHNQSIKVHRCEVHNGFNTKDICQHNVNYSRQDIFYPKK